MPNYIATSGYQYPHWGPSTNDIVDNFYPKKNSGLSWMTQYSQKLFDSQERSESSDRNDRSESSINAIPSVEINCTRYRKLLPSTCRKWYETMVQINPDFRFIIKAPTWITHNKKLNDFETWWDDDYRKNYEELEDMFGAFLFQFPP